MKLKNACQAFRASDFRLCDGELKFSAVKQYAPLFTPCFCTRAHPQMSELGCVVSAPLNGNIGDCPDTLHHLEECLPECDVGLVGYEMAVLVEKTGPFLTPELRAERAWLLSLWYLSADTGVLILEYTLCIFWSIRYFLGNKFIM